MLSTLRLIAENSSKLLQEKIILDDISSSKLRGDVKMIWLQPNYIENNPIVFGYCIILPAASSSEF